MLAQSSSSYTDSDNGIVFQGYTDPVYSITYGAVFPPLSESSTEFIGEIIAPVETKWVGLSLGGAMLKSLLLVAWPYEGAIVSSTRYAQCVIWSKWLVNLLTWNILQDLCSANVCLALIEIYISNRRDISKYDGPTLTNLPSTSVNSTHWKWVFRCQNCTSTWRNLFPTIRWNKTTSQAGTEEALTSAASRCLHGLTVLLQSIPPQILRAPL